MGGVKGRGCSQVNGSWVSVDSDGGGGWNGSCVFMLGVNRHIKFIQANFTMKLAVF